MKKILNIQIMTIILLSLPITVWAHGTEEEHRQEVLFSTIIKYGFSTLVALLILSITILWYTNKKINQINVKTQSGRNEKAGKEKLRKLILVSTGVLVVGVISTGVLAFKDNNSPAVEHSEGSVDFMHIHGLGYSNDGSEVYVPAHDGLRVFKEGTWSIPEGEKHDYMGFNAVDDGFYSSGHPGAGSNLKNPFGVIKSIDLGQNLEILDSDLYGVIDFHWMAVGYKTHAIYVINPQANSRMEDTGLHYTLDETKTWKKSEMKGIEGEAAAIAVHPTEEGTVVMTTNKGVYLSTDYGHQFKQILPNLATAATFNLEGQLIIGNIPNGVSLIEMDINTGDQTSIPTPEIDKEDAISYIAVNPQNPQELIFTTFKRDIYQTKDYGTSWSQLADNGTSLK